MMMDDWLVGLKMVDYGGGSVECLFIFWESFVLW